jgi:hypothetical protein
MAKNPEPRAMGTEVAAAFWGLPGCAKTNFRGPQPTGDAPRSGNDWDANGSSTWPRPESACNFANAPPPIARTHTPGNSGDHVVVAEIRLVGADRGVRCSPRGVPASVLVRSSTSGQSPNLGRVMPRASTRQ